MQPRPDLIGRVGTPLPLIAHHQRATGDDAGHSGQPDPLPNVAHRQRLSRSRVLGVNSSTLTLDQALDETRTGDLWLFRGSSRPDRAIQTLTNAPVNHVGMTVAIDDLPPLIWHAELGDKLVDMWTGTNHRGVQLNDARDVFLQWTGRYQQRCWLRQLAPHANHKQENELLRVIARMDGTAFPTTAKLTGRWLRGLLPTVNDWFRGIPLVEKRVRERTEQRRAEQRKMGLSTAYCAETVAITYEEMGLLVTDKDTNWFDPGKFWSGDTLPLAPGYELGKEIAVVG
ncbi:MAG: guanylate cyclase [Mycobacterium sp.]|nr:MAG: guanylate cyclase [Mycobacterium sp.]